MKAVLKIQSEIMKSIREFLTREGFLEILPPLFDSVTDPGLRDAQIFEFDYYGKPYKLMSALTVHKPIIATYLGKIFSFVPSFRKESEESKFSGRHLSQFWQIEVELIERGYKDAMEVLEKLIQFVIKEVKEKCKKELEILERELKVPEIPFKRISFKEAVDILKELGFDVSYEKELTWGAEKSLSLKIGEMFFITDYPIGSRGFYDKSDGIKLLDFDLMYPEGFGEASSGSEREFEYEKVLEKLEDPEKYRDYLEILKKGIRPTAGFGVGLERLTRFICGLKEIKDATPFPKLPGG